MNALAYFFQLSREWEGYHSLQPGLEFITVTGAYKEISPGGGRGCVERSVTKIA